MLVLQGHCPLVPHLPCFPDDDFLRNGGCDFGCGNLILADDVRGGSGLALPGAVVRGVGEGTLGGLVASSVPSDFPPLPNDIPLLLKRNIFCLELHLSNVMCRSTDLFLCLDVCFQV